MVIPDETRRDREAVFVRKRVIPLRKERGRGGTSFLDDVVGIVI